MSAIYSFLKYLRYRQAGVTLKIYNSDLNRLCGLRDPFFDSSLGFAPYFGNHWA